MAVSQWWIGKGFLTVSFHGGDRHERATAFAEHLASLKQGIKTGVCYETAEGSTVNVYGKKRVIESAVAAYLPAVSR